MKILSYIFLFMFVIALTLNAQDDKTKKSCDHNKDVKIEKQVNTTTAGLKDKTTKKVVKKEVKKVVVTDGKKKECSTECEKSCEDEE
ncbi:MAG TPA: hypothetical protein VFF33_06790 [Ignavibacteriaceae bacterium]|nr:hypothetical protein [Ignavibacteriaceae bacterium]